MLACGVLGFFMRRFGMSPAALVIALVLGPMAEETLRQTLIISDGSFDIFVERNTSLGAALRHRPAAVAAADLPPGQAWSRHRSARSASRGATRPAPRASSADDAGEAGDDGARRDDRVDSS